MKLTMEDISLMNALERVTGVSAKDCIAQENVVSFLVNSRDVGKAIGKGAVNVKLLEDKLKKKIEIVGYKENPEDVVCDALEVKIKGASKKEGRLFISLDGTEKRKALSNIGRVKRLREFMKRNFGLEMILS